MAGVARSGFQALANAVWSLVSLANRTVTPSGGSIGSVTGSVASVTGAVGSVTGAVGSVTGNVGGNVVGSVGSVTAGVTLANDAITAAKIAADAIGASEFAQGAADKVWGTAARSLTDKTQFQTVRQIVKMVVAAIGTINDGNTENVTISPALVDHGKAFIASHTGFRTNNPGVYLRISANTTLEVTNASGASQAIEAFNVEIVEYY